MTLKLKPITNAAKRRAQSADPNLRRCLIENCSKTQAVEVAHVFSRESLTYLIEGLEWNWAMKKGTLNLDTRQNIFFLGASMHEMYKNKIWALLPEKDVVYQYFDKEGSCPLKRPKFPQVEGDTFQYKILPIQDMEDVYITRQTTNSNEPFAVHDYPFEDLPTITSHVHPKFAILHLGQILRNRGVPTKKTLMQKLPWLEDVSELFTWWTSRVPDYAKNHLPYIDLSSNSPSHSPESISVLSNRDLDTPPRRIQHILTVGEGHGYASSHNAVTPSETHSGRTSEHCNPAHKAVTKKRSADEELEDPDRFLKRRTLTSGDLKRQDEREDLESVKWTSARISSWARDLCPPPPPPSPLPPSPPPLPTIIHPLRRSARLKAKMRRA
ncbi:hypothetical protein BJ165DRAFT_1501962 [Panaeolus papilionaceus]|nr:hypothetical protein BJ165DRAFT_1501962 [Panaeolus papilionaceus]